jgi:hypothetical protein
MGKKMNVHHSNMEDRRISLEALIIVPNCESSHLPSKLQAPEET